MAKYSFRVEWDGGAETFSTKEKAYAKASKLRSNGVPCSIYDFVKGKPHSTLTLLLDMLPAPAVVAITTHNAHLFNETPMLLSCKDVDIANAAVVYYTAQGYKAYIAE